MTNLVYAGSGHVLPYYARKYNMLRPVRWGYTSDPLDANAHVMSWDTAHYFKDWVIYNTKLDNATSSVDSNTTLFGAFTTAPDGSTDTARLIAENNTNSKHRIVAGVSRFSTSGPYGKIRLAGVFKYAGRRVILQMSAGHASSSGDSPFGCKAIFDIEAGQVAVDTAYFFTGFGPFTPPAPWTVFPAVIRAVGNGWYLCYIEALVNTAAPALSNGLFGIVSLDQGRGTGIEKSTYIGDGISGVYGWRSNMIPPRMWDTFSEVVFFDDFDDPTMANIDLTNSCAPGFDWYIKNNQPSYDNNTGDPLPVTDITKLSVVDSVISCASHPVPLWLSTFAALWNNTHPLPREVNEEYVGRGWVPPYIFENSSKFDFALSGGPGDVTTIWQGSVEMNVKGGWSDADGSFGPGREIEVFETLFSTLPQTHVHLQIPGPKEDGSGGGNGYQIGNNWCFPSDVGLWFANIEHGVGQHREHLGVRYTALTNNLNKPPASNPSDWGPYAHTTLGGAPPPLIDVGVFHTYALIVLPATADEPGQIFSFWDDGYCSFSLVYGPTIVTVPDTDISPSDWQQMSIFLGSCASMPLDVDWVRITK